MRYRFIKDDDGHLYKIPADKREEAETYFAAVYSYWDRLPEDEEPPEEPEWLEEVGGSLSSITFENPE